MVYLNIFSYQEVQLDLYITGSKSTFYKNMFFTIWKCDKEIWTIITKITTKSIERSIFFLLAYVLPNKRTQMSQNFVLH
jgi:hypothetical protein